MDFSPQINKFQTIGTYEYKFDEAGNVVVDSSSVEFSYNYLSLPLSDVVYDTKKIESYYDVNFSEFVPNASEEVKSTSTETELALAEENSLLKQKIGELIDLSEQDSSVAKNEAIKQVIIDLRISLKQGKNITDFSEEFPYMPKPIN